MTNANENTVSNLNPGNEELSQNYPNPFNSSTNIRFSFTEFRETSH
ncbi:MAG: hypothetical protein IPH77_17715 [Ignavibacteria bacterium]|nr:hypothetical protein [Ignavibacteria bacterium]